MKIKGAIVGVSYGTVYISALAALKNVELTALVSKGSKMSQKIAKLINFPLFYSVQKMLESAKPQWVILDVPHNLFEDFAEESFRHHVDMIAEHPISESELTAILKLAKKHKWQFVVNSHFIYLKPVQDFLSLCD